jgi:hypothetical protein
MVEGGISKVNVGSASDKVGWAATPYADGLAMTHWPDSSSSEFGHQVAESPLVPYENDASAPVEIWDSRPSLLDQGRHVAGSSIWRQAA